MALDTRGQICKDGSREIQSSPGATAAVPLSRGCWRTGTGKSVSSHTCFSSSFFKALSMYLVKRLYSQLEGGQERRQESGLCSAFSNRLHVHLGGRGEGGGCFLTSFHRGT